MLWMSSSPRSGVQVNRRLAQFLGTDATELGETWPGCVHPDDVRAAMAEFAAAARERRDSSFEMRVRRHDGAWRWVHNVGTPRLAADGTFMGFSGSLIDITERRDAERALRLEADASALLAGSLDLDTLLDRLAALGVPLLGDACLLDLFRHGEHVRRMAAHCVSPAHRALMDEMLDRSGRVQPDPYLLGRVLATRQALLMPTITDDLVQGVAGHDPRLAEIIRRSGLRSLLMVPLVARGEVLGAISYIVVESDRQLGDRELALATAVAGRAAAALQNAELYAAARAEIAERVRAEAERAASEATLRGFFDADGVYACVLEIDDVHDDFVFALPNGPFAATYGFTAQEFAGTGARALGIPEDRIAWFLGILRACRDRGAPTTVEISPSKTIRPLSRLGSINPVRRATDGRTVLVYVGTDITERKRLEAQLQQSQKMEAVGRLAGGVAHDFNNLLTVIGGCVEFLSAELRPGEPPWHDAMQIRRAAERGADLTRQLLTFSRRQVVRPRRVDVNALVQDTEKMFRRLLGEDILLQFTLGAEAPSTFIDPGQLEQALLNLAVNARDAMPRGGRLGIATSNARFDASDAAARPGLAPGRYVCLSVSDTGVGMDAATQARIFEPFFTTKEPGKGTGLGLSTVFGIVQQAGGQVIVYSEPNVGTTFRVFLPGAPS
ncbi:MAG: PAS domain S-box protein, partial [Gemmatimonadota bacterium]|nr:PAS domain S-box protein [Gemmatimonadota bacterium]